MIFSGGLSYDKPCRRPSLTIMHGKAITVLEMDHPIVDFLTLCETPYPNGEFIGEKYSYGKYKLIDLFSYINHVPGISILVSVFFSRKLHN